MTDTYVLIGGVRRQLAEGETLPSLWAEEDPRLTYSKATPLETSGVKTFPLLDSDRVYLNEKMGDYVPPCHGGAIVADLVHNLEVVPVRSFGLFNRERAREEKAEMERLRIRVTATRETLRQGILRASPEYSADGHYMGRVRELENVLHGFYSRGRVEKATLTIGKSEWKVDRDTLTAPGVVCVYRYTVRKQSETMNRKAPETGASLGNRGTLTIVGTKGDLILLRESRYWSIEDLVANFLNSNSIKGKFDALFTPEETPVNPLVLTARAEGKEIKKLLEKAEVFRARVADAGDDKAGALKAFLALERIEKEISNRSRAQNALDYRRARRTSPGFLEVDSDGKPLV